jgi:hypothetical protein
MQFVDKSLYSVSPSHKHKPYYVNRKPAAFASR